MTHKLLLKRGPLRKTSELIGIVWNKAGISTAQLMLACDHLADADKSRSNEK